MDITDAVLTWSIKFENAWSNIFRKVADRGEHWKHLHKGTHIYKTICFRIPYEIFREYKSIIHNAVECGIISYTFIVRISYWKVMQMTRIHILQWRLSTDKVIHRHALMAVVHFSVTKCNCGLLYFNLYRI